VVFERDDLFVLDGERDLFVPFDWVRDFAFEVFDFDVVRRLDALPLLPFPFLDPELRLLAAMSSLPSSG
jgi:hypothetical protein